MRKYLIVVPSSCQMYSGTGTAIFDWIRYAKTDFEFSILMDVENYNNLKITADFCKAHGVPFHISSPLHMPGSPDSGIKNVAAHLHANSYDFIECVSWANAATNAAVLASKRNGARLVYTPHSQPAWTLDDHGRYFMVPEMFKKTIQMSDFVFIDSNAEMDLPEFSGADRKKIHFVPLGVDGDKFKDHALNEEFRILSVCDFREKRKRVDLLIQAFVRAHSMEPRLKLTLAGKGSDSTPVPESIAGSVTRLGYVDSAELVQLYQQASLFVLLSDYEAFGLPIAESLSCGTPVLINSQDALVELFGHMPGVAVTRNTDIDTAARMMRDMVLSSINRADVARMAADRFSFDSTYGRKKEILLQ